MESGYRESTQSWTEVLRDLRDRGMPAPLVAVGGGALGLWAALDQIFLTTEQQCAEQAALRVGKVTATDRGLPTLDHWPGVGRSRSSMGLAAHLVLTLAIGEETLESSI